MYNFTYGREPSSARECGCLTRWKSMPGESESGFVYILLCHVCGFIAVSHNIIQPLGSFFTCLLSSSFFCCRVYIPLSCAIVVLVIADAFCVLERVQNQFQLCPWRDVGWCWCLLRLGGLFFFLCNYETMDGLVENCERVRFFFVCVLSWKTYAKPNDDKFSPVQNYQRQLEYWCNCRERRKK